MMIDPQVTQTASRLMDALEKMRQSSGSDLRIDGLSGQPSENLIKAFQEAMNLPDQTAKTPEVGDSEFTGNDQKAFQVQPDVLQPTAPGPAESMPPVQHSEAISQDFHKNASLNTEAQTVDANMDRMKELAGILEKAFQAGNAITPADLYRVQYLTGMFKLHTQTGLNVSQQTSQSIESLLRQQG